MPTNATLSYGTRSIGIFVVKMAYPMMASIDRAQTRKGTVGYFKYGASQDKITVSGVCSNNDDYFALSEFIRAWQTGVVGGHGGSITPMTFSLRGSQNPTHKPNFTRYLVTPLQFRYMRKVTDVAPSYELEMVVVSGKTTNLYSAVSPMLGDYVWEQPTMPTDIKSDGDDAFAPPSRQLLER